MRYANFRARCRCRRTGRRGSTLIEFLLLLPLLAMIFLVALDLGRIAYIDIALRNAVRVGGQYASEHVGGAFTPGALQEAWLAKIRQVIVDEMALNEWFEPDKLSVATPVVTDVGNGTYRVAVEATYPFEPLFTGAGEYHFVDYGPITLRRSIVSVSIDPPL